MSEKAFDYKKEYKDLYAPGQKPVAIEVPPMDFIMVDGQGAPGGREYVQAVEVLYALSYAIKMSKMSGRQPEGYFEYVVPPLEGLWQVDARDMGDRERWRWTSLIRQPDFVDGGVFERALQETGRKKPELDLSMARFGRLDEGLCVQIMHVGPYNDEHISLAKVYEFMDAHKLAADLGPERRHHEIYLGDPHKTAPEKLRTIMRVPAKRI